MPSCKRESKQGIQIINSPDLETERLKRDVYRSDKEKFQLLAAMFRRNALLKKVKITHK